MSFLEKVMKFRSPGNSSSSAFEVVERPAIIAKEENVPGEEISFADNASNTPQEGSSSLLDASIPVRILDGKRRKRKIPQSKSDFDFVESVLCQNQYQHSEDTLHEEDGDKLFLLSLFGPMKKIPDNLRFGVRLQIMQVVYNALCGDIRDQSMDTNSDGF